jgi:hypothetical protein
VAIVLTLRAYAYVNNGRWVADCPRPHCNNAVTVEPTQSTFYCAGRGGCQLVAPLAWPLDVKEIWSALMARPVPATRNWAPAGHRQAIVTGHPDGQTAADLRDETARYTETEGV